jgi:hypothetical protein
MDSLADQTIGIASLAVRSYSTPLAFECIRYCTPGSQNLIRLKEN